MSSDCLWREENRGNRSRAVRSGMLGSSGIGLGKVREFENMACVLTEGKRSTM